MSTLINAKELRRRLPEVVGGVKKGAEAWWKQVEGSARLQGEPITPERAEKARHLFFRYADKEFSFTDCTSFVVMQQLKLKHALTTDRHFKQMGFQTVP